MASIRRAVAADCADQLGAVTRRTDSWSVQRLVEGDSLGDTLSRLFHNTPLKPPLDKLVLTSSGADH